MKARMENIEYCGEISSIATFCASKADLLVYSILFKGIYLQQYLSPCPSAYLQTISRCGGANPAWSLWIDNNR
jgi:hypothetical protein